MTILLPYFKINIMLYFTSKLAVCYHNGQYFNAYNLLIYRMVYLLEQWRNVLRFDFAPMFHDTCYVADTNNAHNAARLTTWRENIKIIFNFKIIQT